ncbi:thionin-like protein 2 [Quillaja saponaria]|uniref:Thionin-like protein 2 n=1 Tax=Quillaja saponaria TaxID=32244 RepID=A0AAD7L591_QUISA|nr:thionin-like protein 2 [Quillaja saponaria]
MEGKIMRTIVIFTLFLGVLVGQSSADFVGCYPGCLLQCALSDTKWYICPIKCTTDCLKQAEILGNPHANNAHFCKLGCAVTKCSKLSTKTDPAVDKVNTCVNACSASCLKY